MLPYTIPLIWLLALLAAAIHLRDGGRTVRSALWAAAGFALVLPAALWLAPQPNWIAVLVTIGAMARLIAGGGKRSGPLLAGISAGLAASLVAAAGIEPWPAAMVTFAALLAAFGLQSGSARASPRDEHLLVGVALMLPVVGLSGDLIYGWQAAGMLGEGAKAAGALEPPVWALAIVGLAIVAGLVRGLWASR
ncbi:hypothetical protein D2V17_10385 [Aurantiacibacter xanthus]|uniref:Uncharacterized protein n=1 Tax=Aurantiacibacter xanthus TaxID=1784712 RepID=A0A3A1P7H3_9SPHN|nr:hypothetical protein [Aurantiacibacter xanthus]RIV85493.1 hypothetical protein D2V17_10385 [Aurantiacibacter xanthus]